MAYVDISECLNYRCDDKCYLNAQNVTKK